MCSFYAASQQNGGAESFRSAEFELSTSLIAVIRRWSLPFEPRKTIVFIFSPPFGFQSAHIPAVVSCHKQQWGVIEP
jgi:hypothetical protein